MSAQAVADRYGSRWSTPGWLRGFLWAIAALAGLLTLTGIIALRNARSALLKLGRDTAPSIIAAQEIGSSLADLDANCANYLIGNKHHRDGAMAAFAAQRHRVNERLVDAARNITEDGEEEAIKRMFDGLSRYLEVCAEARFRYDAGDPAGATSSYNVGTELMHKSILPAADALDAVNYKVLERSYREEQGVNVGAALLVGLAGALLAGVLIHAQLFLFRRTRRVFNPALLAATVITLGATFYLITRIVTAREDLRVAKEDAFKSIHALFQARTLAYDLNGDESRYLMKGASSRAYEAAFDQKLGLLTTLAEPSPAELALLDRGPPPASFNGLLAEELRNITFDGELVAAMTAVRYLGDYHRVDRKIRELEHGGKPGGHDDAVELAIGTLPHESNAKFELFDKALLETIDINRKQCDGKVDDGDRALGKGIVAVPIAGAAVALLALLGLRARMREYRA